MKIRIEWTYATRIGAEAFFRSDEMPVAQALLIAEDIEKTGRVKKIDFIDQYDSSWLLKELKSYLKSIETEPHNVRVYFDGGFDIQTKMSGMGCVIYYEQSGKAYRLRSNAPSAHLISNNEAEYAALHMCLNELELLGVHHLPVTFIGDSQVVINQLSGEWAVIEPSLSGWADRVEEKMKKLGIDPTYELVPRKENGEADRLATQALNGIEIIANSELL